ncbi:MAG: alpha/beta hydrolase [Chlamydiales bacterium]
MVEGEGVDPKKIIHLSSREGYINSYEISETMACIYSIDPSEGSRVLKNRRTALLVLDSFGTCTTRMVEALIAENAYDVHVHYLYPKVLCQSSLKKHFYQFLLQLTSAPGGLNGTIDLFTTPFSTGFALESLKAIPGKFFDGLFIVPSCNSHTASKELLLIKQIVNKLSSDEHFNSHFTSCSYPSSNGPSLEIITITESCLQKGNSNGYRSLFNGPPHPHYSGGNLLRARITPENGQKRGYSNLFVPRKSVYEVIALKCKELDSPSSTRALKETLIVSDCENFLNQDCFSGVQQWKKKLPNKEWLKRLAGSKVAIFVHGMNNTAAEAYDSYALLSSQIYQNYDYLLYYIWPGASVLAHESYNNAKNKKLTTQYRELLENLKKDPSTTVDVIAHSMGNRFTFETLNLLQDHSEKVIDNFFMVAPAVPHDCFEKEQELYYHSSQFIKNIFVLWTDHDMAMSFYPTYPAGSPLTKGLGHGVKSAEKLPSHVMAIALSGIVPGHGLVEFNQAFPLISRLGVFKRRYPSAKMEELQSEVHAFFREKNLPIRYKQWIDLGLHDDGMLFEHPVCQFKDTQSPTKCLYDPHGIFDDRLFGKKINSPPSQTQMLARGVN